MRTIYLFLLALALSACISEHEINAIQGETPVLHPGGELDVVLVIDNSCSMWTEWNAVGFGLSMVAIELAETDLDWQLALTSADQTDLDLWIDLTEVEEPGWAMASAISEIKSEGEGGEEGFSAILAHQEFRPHWFRGGLTMIVFVSDEPEQSDPEITPREFYLRWNTPVTVTSIVGRRDEFEAEPPEYMSCDAQPAPKYHAVADQFVHICTNDPWTIIFPLFQP